MEYMGTVEGQCELLVFRSAGGGYIETFTYAQAAEALGGNEQ